MANASSLPEHFNSSSMANLRYDLPAGVVVFLVALPLCLGIALASGAPLFAGVITGIIGGIAVSIVSGSPLSVSGPAAGLTVIVAAAIQGLGSYEVFLVAVVLAGFIQVALGYLRAGIIGDYVPTSVIKGMLSAIGIVIMLKQIPHALGKDGDYEGDMGFFQTDKENTFTEILGAVTNYNLEAIIICAMSFVVLFIWQQQFIQRIKFCSYIPGALLVVILGIVINENFRSFGGDFYLKAEDGHLVNLPVATSFTGFFQFFTLPDFSAAITNKQVYSTAITLAIVASLETLLSLEAVDKLDPFRRISPTSRELKAQGMGNVIAGLLGGLPMTAVIVRSSANVYAGGRTRGSAIFHGVLLLICVALIPVLLNKIPLASLAVVLIVVGYKLASIKIFKQMYKSGIEQFIPFIVTVVAIVFTDLLVGILIGCAVGLFFVIKTNHYFAVTLVHDGQYYLMRFNKDMSFVNKSELKEKLLQIPDDTTVLVDATRCRFVDADIYDVVHDFMRSSEYRGITVELKNFESKEIHYSSTH